jgi:hypothetical protein
MRNNGMEWLHSLASEPGRLRKRYLVTNRLFIVGAVRQLFGRSVARSKRWAQQMRSVVGLALASLEQTRSSLLLSWRRHAKMNPDFDVGEDLETIRCS